MAGQALRQFSPQVSDSVVAELAGLKVRKGGARAMTWLHKQKKNGGIAQAWQRICSESGMEQVVGTVVDAVKRFHKPVMLAVIMGFLLAHNPADALAAGGGRVGGKAFSSGSRSSQTYSTPSGSFSGGGVVTYSAPYIAPSPFFGGYGGVYVAPAYGVGFGGFGLLFLLVAAAVLVTGFLSDRSEGGLLGATEKTSVLKLQVGLLGSARNLQRDLERLAHSADTSTPEGLHFVLTETVLTLLRHPDFCISGTASSDVKRSPEEGEAMFNQLSLEERGKFDDETLVNVDSFTKRSFSVRKPERFNNEYIVVTLLVAAEGEYKLSQINSSADLRSALTSLGSIPADSIQAVEVLWTPQDENDTLSEQELLRDYPLLRSL